MRATAALILLVALGGCQRQPDPGKLPRDFALKSATIALPDDAEQWPAGTDVLAANCGACHSAGMILTQPGLKPEQWAATVKKMREAYHAPVADSDVPAILAALERLSVPPAAAQSPANPATAP